MLKQQNNVSPSLCLEWRRFGDYFVATSQFSVPYFKIYVYSFPSCFNLSVNLFVLFLWLRIIDINPLSSVLGRTPISFIDNLCIPSKQFFCIKKQLLFYEIKHTYWLILFSCSKLSLLKWGLIEVRLVVRMRDEVKSMFTRSIVRVHYWWNW